MIKVCVGRFCIFYLFWFKWGIVIYFLFIFVFKYFYRNFVFIKEMYRIVCSNDLDIWLEEVIEKGNFSF